MSPVRSRAQRRAFVECEYALHRADACWVPPLRRDRYRLLSRTRNPFLSFGEVALYLARRGGQVVGRIAAVHNPRFNRHHGTRDGFFGLFTCVDDPDVARRLFQAAGSWLIERNMTSMVGPVNFSTNYECGALVDGFDLPAALLMPWNPPSTPVLIESCGFTAVQDLHAWEWACVPKQPEALGRVAAAAVRRGDITVRTVDVLDYATEMRRIRDLYHRAWQDNWGFVPMTGREFQHLADQLRPALRPELALIAEVAGEPAGFSLTLPDLAPAFRAAGGRLHRWGVPTGLARVLRAVTPGPARPADGAGRRRGVPELRSASRAPGGEARAARRLGYEAVEISWVLDSNKPALRSLRAAGCRRTKTYRIYRRELRHGSYEQALRNH